MTKEAEKATKRRSESGDGLLDLPENPNSVCRKLAAEPAHTREQIFVAISPIGATEACRDIAASSAI
ncbi:hypothetical protein [Mesorhizobium sp. IMUNJ 23232]|uniref:hypothetical protein n=1 Tax=Mesorhizobium sp. IMUNJ 23232 TaxID=3376064 RepID=UPI00378DE5F7